MQPEPNTLVNTQAEFDLGFTADDELHNMLDTLRVYSFRISQRGSQPYEGRYGTQDWLKALKVLVTRKGIRAAMEERETVLTLIAEHDDPSGLALANLGHDSWMVITHGEGKP